MLCVVCSKDTYLYCAWKCSCTKLWHKPGCVCGGVRVSETGFSSPPSWPWNKTKRSCRHLDRRGLTGHTFQVLMRISTWFLPHSASQHCTLILTVCLKFQGHCTPSPKFSRAFFRFFVFLILSYQNACYGCENAENRNWSYFFMTNESFGGSV